MNSKDIQLPKGWHAQKSGGRPRKDAKFIAMAMAFHWRVHVLGEKVWVANEWIFKHWGGQGVNTDAHMRAIRTRMHKGATAPLRRVFLLNLEGFQIAVTPDSQRGWLWNESMHDAYKVTGTVVQRRDPTDPRLLHISVDLKGDELKPLS